MQKGRAQNFARWSFIFLAARLRAILLFVKVRHVCLSFHFPRLMCHQQIDLQLLYELIPNLSNVFSNTITHELVTMIAHPVFALNKINGEIAA